MAAKFWLPYWSIWLPPMITWRRPFQTQPNIWRYGLKCSTTLPSGHAVASSLAMRRASPSVIARSGSKVARARRPPIIGMVPIGLQRISPSPRKHSAMATTHTSARVTRSVSESRHQAVPPSVRSLAW